MTYASRFIASFALISVFAAPSAFAHPDPALEGEIQQAWDKQTPEIKSKAPNELKLPTKDEIEAIKEQLPDMTGIMTDMMVMLKDEDMREGMMGSLEMLKEHIDTDALKKTEDGIPDMNAMIGSMLELFGDEEFVGGLTQNLAPLQEMMEKHVPETQQSGDAPDWH